MKLHSGPLITKEWISRSTLIHVKTIQTLQEETSSEYLNSAGLGEKIKDKK